MKAKLLLFALANRGGLILMAICMVLSLVAAWIVSLCGAEYATAVFTAQIFGILGILMVSALFWICDKPVHVGSEWGVLGTIIGMALTMIIY